MTTWHEVAEVSVVWVLVDGTTRAACVIDGREYVDEASYRAARSETFRLLDGRKVLDQIESFPAADFAVPPGLPSWAAYRATLDE